jgi:hypothetical protein
LKHAQIWYILSLVHISQSRSYVVDKSFAWRLWYSTYGEGESDEYQFFLDLWDWQGVSTQYGDWQPNTWYHNIFQALQNLSMAAAYPNTIKAIINHSIIEKPSIWEFSVNSRY